MKRILSLLFSVLLCAALLPPTALSASAETLPPSGSGRDAGAGETRLYGIGSVSKVFTAAAVMKLVDGGKLDLDVPVVQYITDFTMADSRYADITPRMLLNHSSGLMGMTDNNVFLMGDNEPWNHDHFLELLRTQSLKHTPGDRSIYSNDSFTLAEILVERVSGMSFTRFLEVNFTEPLGLSDVGTPQSSLNRDRFAPVYLDGKELQPENLGVIGSGGMYASAEDLCRFSQLFMESADGSVLSRAAADEMAKNQHRMPLTAPGADTTFTYGLGWDSVDAYPFHQYGIRALSKGGGTGFYHSNLTVLPAQNLAVAVVSSGQDSQEQLIAQEIILEVLREEGLLKEAAISLPEYTAPPARIPADVKACAGLYDGGQGYLIQAGFTDDTLTLTPIGTRNERPQVYRYNADGLFVSTGGDYMHAGGLASAQDGTRGVSALSFAENRYMLVQSYETLPGLSQTAQAMPIAERVEENPVSDAVWAAWSGRVDTEYLLISEKYSSARYLSDGIAKIQTDNRAPGYVGVGIYEGSGRTIKNARIVDAQNAVGFQSAPTMIGRDTNNLSVLTQSGNEILKINEHAYVDASSIGDTSSIDGRVRVTGGAVWYNVGANEAGQSWEIQVPDNASWFTYDNKMNCIATSLEKEPARTISLPADGRIAFVGEEGVEFLVQPAGTADS